MDEVFSIAQVGFLRILVRFWRTLWVGSGFLHRLSFKDNRSSTNLVGGALMGRFLLEN